MRFGTKVRKFFVVCTLSLLANSASEANAQVTRPVIHEKGASFSLWMDDKDLPNLCEEALEDALSDAEKKSGRRREDFYYFECAVSEASNAGPGGYCIVECAVVL